MSESTHHTPEDHFRLCLIGDGAAGGYGQSRWPRSPGSFLTGPGAALSQDCEPQRHVQGMLVLGELKKFLVLSEHPTGDIARLSRPINYV